MKANIFANYVGQFWSTFMTVAFVPVYVAYLGPESFGLIGILAALQACFGLLDLGMSPLIGRESARFVSGAHTPFGIRSLLRTVEILVCAFALLVMVSIYAASGWIATGWLKPVQLRPADIAVLITVMGAIVGLRLIESLYRAVLNGLQHQVSLNAGIVIVSTLRGFGSALVLMFVSPTIGAFLVWQVLCSVSAVVLFWWLSYRRLPSAGRRVPFSLAALGEVWRFAAGMTVISVLAVLLTQTDKLILSNLLPLSDFGTYALAATVAAIPQVLISPVLQTLQPRLTMQVAAADEAGVSATFHLGAQIVSALMGSAAIVLMIFSDQILAIWLQNDRIGRDSAALVSLLALGNLLNGLMWVPYATQLAHGWTGLAVRTNLVAVAVLLPALLWVTPRYGATGAAWVWVGLNSGYFAIQAGLMFRRILTTEMLAWYLVDVARPLAVATSVALAMKWIEPPGMGTLPTLAFLLATSTAVLLAAAAASPAIVAVLRRMARARSA